MLLAARLLSPGSLNSIVYILSYLNVFSHLTLYVNLGGQCIIHMFLYSFYFFVALLDLLRRATRVQEGMV